jgi:hypothetical protein
VRVIIRHCLAMAAPCVVAAALSFASGVRLVLQPGAADHMGVLTTCTLEQQLHQHHRHDDCHDRRCHRPTTTCSRAACQQHHMRCCIGHSSTTPRRQAAPRCSHAVPISHAFRGKVGARIVQTRGRQYGLTPSCSRWTAAARDKKSHAKSAQEVEDCGVCKGSHLYSHTHVVVACSCETARDS